MPRRNDPAWYLDKVRRAKVTKKAEGVVDKMFNIAEDTTPINLTSLGRQVGGDHYKKHTIQPWDIIDEYKLDYYAGNALKYLLRNKDNKKQDLEKAKHYLEKMIGDL